MIASKAAQGTQDYIFSRNNSFLILHFLAASLSDAKLCYFIFDNRFAHNNAIVPDF